MLGHMYQMGRKEWHYLVDQEFQRSLSTHDTVIQHNYLPNNIGGTHKKVSIGAEPRDDYNGSRVL